MAHVLFKFISRVLFAIGIMLSLLCSCSESDPEFIESSGLDVNSMHSENLQSKADFLIDLNQNDSVNIHKSEADHFITIEMPYLRLDWIGDNLNWDPVGNSVEFTSNLPFEDINIEKSADWIECSVTRDSSFDNSDVGKYLLNIRASLNPTPELRTGIIKISNPHVEKEFKIYQLGVAEYPRCPPSARLGLIEQHGEKITYYFDEYIDRVWRNLLPEYDNFEIVFPENIDWLNYEWLGNSIKIFTDQFDSLDELPFPRKFTTSMEIRVRSRVFDESYFITSMEIYIDLDKHY